MTAVCRTPYFDGEENRERVTPNMGGRVEVYHLWHKPKLADRAKSASGAATAPQNSLTRRVPLRRPVLLWTAGHRPQRGDQSRSILDRPEVIFVGGLNGCKGQLSDFLPSPCEAKAKGAGVMLVRLPCDQALGL